MSIRATGNAAAIASAALWVAATGLGLAGMGFEGMLLSLALLLLYGAQGAARKDRLAPRFFVYPLLAWVVLWAVSFVLARHYADLYGGRMPDFTILGLHPSFAWTVLGYWIGGVLTLSVGFLLFRDDWLSAADWEEFKAKVAPERGSEGGEP